MSLTSNNTKSLFSLIGGIGLLFTGTLISPMGEIHSTVLIGAGECLVLAAVLAGCGEVVNKFLELIDELRSFKTPQVNNSSSNKKNR